MEYIKTVSDDSLVINPKREDDPTLFFSKESGQATLFKKYTIQNNEIWYTTNDSKTTITPTQQGYDNLIKMGLQTNDYSTGKGIMEFSSDITEIFPRTFNTCENILTLKLPKTVTSIGQYAFYACVNLTEITIPKSVTSLASGSFGVCDKLKYVYYDGTIEEWNKISRLTARLEESHPYVVCTDGTLPL